MKHRRQFDGVGVLIALTFGLPACDAMLRASWVRTACRIGAADPAALRAPDSRLGMINILHGQVKLVLVVLTVAAVFRSAIRQYPQQLIVVTNLFYESYKPSWPFIVHGVASTRL